MTTAWVEGYLPTARQTKNTVATAPWPQPENQNIGITPSPLCGWKGTYQQPGNQSTVATRISHSQLDHCVGGGVPINSQATTTLWQHALTFGWMEMEEPTNREATKTLWQHALATMWVEGYLPNATDTPARTPKLHQNVVMRCIVMQELFSATISSLHNNSIHSLEMDINPRKTD